MTKQIIVSAIVAAIVASLVFVVGGLVGNQSVPLDPLGASGGITRFPNGGLVARYLKVSTSSPQTVGTDGTLSIGGGTNITKYQCNTASWNPGAVGSTTIDQVDVAFSGLVVGDPLSVSISTTTQGLALFAQATSTATATVILFDPDNTGVAINLATTTVKVCTVQ